MTIKVRVTIDDKALETWNDPAWQANMRRLLITYVILKCGVPPAVLAYMPEHSGMDDALYELVTQAPPTPDSGDEYIS